MGGNDTGKGVGIRKSTKEKKMDWRKGERVVYILHGYGRDRRIHKFPLLLLCLFF